MELDDTDRSILRMLQSDARTPFSEIARRIDVSSATVHDRVGRMEDAGVIEGYHASINPDAVGYGVSALIGLRIEQGREADGLERFREIEAIREIRLTTGEWDVVLRVIAADTDALRELLFDRITRTDGFSRSHTMVVLDTDYETDGPPI